MKIFTVHGTFAGDPEKNLIGSKWWQRESEFTDHLVTKLEISKDDIIPFDWGGANDEVVRRSAGKRFFRLLNKTMKECPGEDVVVVSNSHGGNVVLNSFLEGARSATPNFNVKAWITVGTPFFHTTPKFAQIYQAGFLTFPLLISLISIITSTVNQIYFNNFDYSESIVAYLLIFIILAFLFSINFLGILRASREKKYLPIFIADKLHIISHKSDEAIFALRNYSNPIKLPIKNFGSAGLISIILFFIIGFIVYTGRTGESIDLESGVYHFTYADVLMSAVREVITYDPVDLFWSSQFSNLLAGVLAIFVSIAIWIVARTVAVPISHIFEFLAGKLVANKIRQAAFGWNVHESTRVKEEPPSGIIYTHMEMPESIEKQIVGRTNTNFSKYSNEIRSAIAAVNLGHLTVGQAIKNLDSELTEVLVHNGYFENDWVRRKIASIIKSVQ